MLELAGVSKTYAHGGGAVAVLRDVSLRVEAGEFAVVHGPSGCGKSTLLLACGGLLSPEAGRVSVSGTSLYDLSAEARARFRARHIGFVFQQFHLVPYLTVLDNVRSAALPLRARGLDGRARELVERFGLTSRAHHVPAELSTGERQRTALARALLNAPRLLLADEPTGNLDEVSGETVLKALSEFAASGGTVLMVTHDANAARFDSRRVAMREGLLEGA